MGMPAKFKEFATDEFTWINADKKNTQRIVGRFVTVGWWFCCSRRELDYTIVFSAAVNLDTDLRGKLRGVQFSLHEK